VASKRTKTVTAKDVMTRRLVTVQEDTTVRELVTVLLEHEISGAPVVAPSGKLVGVVALSDVAQVASGGGAIVSDRSIPSAYVRGWEETVNPDELRQLHIEDAGLTVGDIMSPIVATVAPGASIAEIASAMVEGHIHRVLVTDNGRLEGIVSSMDLLELLAEPA
jgi:CBS domain-containing protein